MKAVRLDFEELEVTTFDPAPAAAEPTYAAYPTWDIDCCCTGCDSGCGINPTAGGCVSADETYYVC